MNLCLHFHFHFHTPVPCRFVLHQANHANNFFIATVSNSFCYFYICNIANIINGINYIHRAFNLVCKCLSGINYIITDKFQICFLATRKSGILKKLFRLGFLGSLCFTLQSYYFFSTISGAIVCNLIALIYLCNIMFTNTLNIF